MDSEEIIKQDQETQKWLKDIESLRSPPPPRKLITSNDDSRESSHFSTVSIQNGDGGDQFSDGSGDFINKIKQFQLSNSHPYANKSRVETAKKIAAQGGTRGGISSIASEDKQKKIITRQQADQLRDHVKKETRPLNPYPSPYSNLESSNSNNNKRLQIDVNGGSDYSSSAYSSYSSAIDRESKSTGPRMAPGSSPIYSVSSPGSRAPILEDVEPVYRMSEKKVHNVIQNVAKSSPEPSYNLAPSYSPARSAASPRIAANTYDTSLNAHSLGNFPVSPSPQRIDASPRLGDNALLHNVMNDRELSAAFEDFDRDYLSLSNRSLSKSPDHARATVMTTTYASPPVIQNGLSVRAPPPPYRRTNSSSNRFTSPGVISHTRQSSSPLSAPSPPVRHPVEYSIRNRSHSMQEFGIPSNYNTNNNYERAVTGRDIIVDRIPASLLPSDNHNRLHIQKSDSFNAYGLRLSNDGLDAVHRISPAAALEEQQRKFKQLEAQVEKEMQTNAVAYGVCHFCNEKVTNPAEATQALGNLYHARCFTCCSCGRALKGKKFYEVRGKVYCEEDYLFSGFQQSAERCALCGHLIMDMILQAVGKSFHPGCFRCVSCKESLDGVPFTMDDQGRVYCINDYHRLFAPKCAKCLKPITPAVGRDETVRVVAMQNNYHVDCYVCEGCGLQLTDEPEKRCYPLGDHLLCHRCHLHWSRTGGAVHPITDL